MASKGEREYLWKRHGASARVDNVEDAEEVAQNKEEENPEGEGIPISLTQHTPTPVTPSASKQHTHFLLTQKTQQAKCLSSKIKERTSPLSTVHQNIHSLHAIKHNQTVPPFTQRKKCAPVYSA